jgi:hypothetical protein
MQIIFLALLAIFSVCGQNMLGAARACVRFPAHQELGHSGIKTSKAHPTAQNEVAVPYANDNAQYTQIRIDQDTYIYFPVDGRQPTTEQAAEWSCANVDNSKITQWYAKMFGKDGLLKMGFDENGRCVHIISPGGMRGATRGIRKIDFFGGVFLKIASNPLGRVFLYRLLIEIRRQMGMQGCQEQAPSDANTRNFARSVIIRNVDEDEWAYIPTDDPDGRREKHVPVICAYFDPQDRHPRQAIVGNVGNWHTELKDEDNDEYLQSSLFHEMLHWYQELRDKDRFDRERFLPISRIQAHDIADEYSYYNKPIPYLSWGIPFVTGVELNEIRVICGSNRGAPGYLEGDDLSENAFRRVAGYGVVFGHDGDNIGNSLVVEQNAIRAAYQNAISCLNEIIVDPFA